jgi:hypothetical protein
MSTRNETCEARISDHMEGRESQFAALLNPADLDDEDAIAAYVERHTLSDEDTAIVAAVDAGRGQEHYESDVTFDDAYTELADRLRDELQDEGTEHIDESVLGVGTRVVMRIELSTGGPGDWVEAELDDREVQDVTYHFNDWFDHAERRVSQGSALWSLAEYYAEVVQLPETDERPFIPRNY